MSELNELASKATLYKKMSLVMGELTRIKERGQHEKQRWTYATSEDVKDAVRQAMSKHGLALLFSLDEYIDMPTDKSSQTHIRAKLTFTIADGETGETESRSVWSEAIDYSDKAFNKIYTTAEKYFLKTIFLISSGDDVDADIETIQRQSRKQSAVRPANRPFSPSALRNRLTGNGYADSSAPSDALRKYAISSLSVLTNGDDDMQHAIIAYLFGVNSRKDLTAGNCSAIVKWAGATKENEYQPDVDSIAEAGKITEAKTAHPEITFADLQKESAGGGAAYAE